MSVPRLLCALLMVLLISRPAVAGAQANSNEESTSAASGEVESQPWSGWWWPAWDRIGPTLFAPNGPLDKYDQYVAATSGDNPATRAWERQELYVPGVPWAGHCNGFAAAALLEPEPTEPVTVLGITFSVADLKGLLVDYHFGDAAAWSFGEDGQLNPADFQRMLLNWVGGVGQGFILTYEMGNDEVWSYPVYRFETQWTADPNQADLWHVTTTVWMADMDVPPAFVGTKPYPNAAGKKFEYTLQGDPRDPSDGAWTGISKAGRFAHPGRIWFPQATVRTEERQLVSPGLDRQTIANIIAGSDGSDVTAPPPPSAAAASTPTASPMPVSAPSAVATPTATPTPVPVATAVATPTPSPTPVPTATPTPNPSRKAAPTPTPTPKRAAPRP